MINMKGLKDKLNESLIMSYDTDAFIKKLKNIFHPEEIVKHNSKSDPKRFAIKVSETNFNNIYDKSTHKIFDFYGYYITELSYVQDENKYIIAFEPIFGKKCNELVYDECNGIIYHVTSASYTKDILKKGLVPVERWNNDNYRNYSERLFLSCGKTNKEVLDNIKFIIKQLRKNNNYSILRINLKKHRYNVDFYYDPSEDDVHNFIYCNAYFHPSMIEVFDNIDNLEDDFNVKESLKSHITFPNGRKISIKKI